MSRQLSISKTQLSTVCHCLLPFPFLSKQFSISKTQLSTVCHCLLPFPFVSKQFSISKTQLSIVCHCLLPEVNAKQGILGTTTNEIFSQYGDGRSTFLTIHSFVRIKELRSMVQNSKLKTFENVHISHNYFENVHISHNYFVSNI